MKFQTGHIITSATLLLGLAQVSHAHVSFVANNAYAGKSYIAALQIPHGCSDSEGNHYDTTKVEVSIPAGFTGVKPADSIFGSASVAKDEAGNVTKITWTKSAEAAAEDLLYTQLVFRGTPAAEMAIKSLEFVTRQTCNQGDPVVWEGSDVPKLKVYPARSPGWNKYTAQEALDENTLKTFFADAYIVWHNENAYSSNSVTTGMITHALTAIPAGAEFWVKY